MTTGENVVSVASSDEFIPKNTADSEGAALITEGAAQYKKSINR